MAAEIFLVLLILLRTGQVLTMVGYYLLRERFRKISKKSRGQAKETTGQLTSLKPLVPLNCPGSVLRKWVSQNF